MDVYHIPGERNRVALVSDVHGNAPALAACLRDVLAERMDAVVFLGCLTWGPEPMRVLSIACDLPVPTYFIRGNGERAVLELASGVRSRASRHEGLDAWTVAAHGNSGVEILSSFPPAATLHVRGIGNILLCHGSPRSDVELLTPATPDERLRAAFAGVDQPTVAHGHTHVQYVRRAVGKTIVGPGSVGLPYTDGPPGARWCCLGPNIDLRVTPYDLEDAVQAARRVGYPAAEGYAAALLHPPTPAEVLADEAAHQYRD
jgi:predicted phosphodiesterase